MSVEAFVGEIRMFAGTFPPRHWMFCDGQLLSISQHQALFSLLGTNYGGDGRSTFSLPDLRGRVPLHAGGSQGPGLSRYNEGQRGGREFNELTVAQIPSHSHTITRSGSSTGGLKFYNDVGDQNQFDTNTKSLALTGTKTRLGSSPTGNAFSSQEPNTTLSDAVAVNLEGLPTSTGSTGGDNLINNMQPFTAINFIICLEGVFPPRS